MGRKRGIEYDFLYEIVVIDIVVRGFKEFNGIGDVSMKKSIYAVFTIVLLFFISSCSSVKDMTDYVDVSFSGMDNMGVANYEVDEEKLIEEVFDYDEDIDFIEEETLKEMNDLEEAYKIQLDKEEDLSNDDIVTLIVSVNEDKTDKIKGGEKEVTVSGLEEPDILTSKDVEDNLVLNFNGASGKGTANIENTFNDSVLSEVVFEVENNGELENEEYAEVVIDDEAEKLLHEKGYILDEDFNPTFEVEGLHNVAENAKDIENIEDVKRMIDEEVEKDYKDRDAIKIFYEIEKEAMMYRQFNEEEEENAFPEDPDNNGNLVVIYSVEKMDEISEEREEFIAIVGYADIKLDDEGKANLSEMVKISDKKDDTYSLKTIIQLYEGNGYKEIKD